MDRELYNSLLENPSRTVVTRDTRYDKDLGRRLDDPATAFIAKDGSYVVKSDTTEKSSKSPTKTIQIGNPMVTRRTHE